MAAKPLIYIGSRQYNARDWPNVYKVDSADNDFGSIRLGFDNQATVSAIRGDSAGNVYFATDRDTISGHSAFKYHRDGKLLWSGNHGARLMGIAFDSSGNIYACGFPANGTEQYYSGSRTGYYTLRKWDSSGVLQWSIDGEPTAVNPGNYDYDSSIVVCPDGDIVVGSVTISEPGVIGGIRKHSAATGDLIWQWNNEAVGYGLSMRYVDVDASGNVYGFDQTGANAAWIVSLDSDGNLLWSRSLESGRSLYDFGMANDEIVCLTLHSTWSSWPGNLIKLSAVDGSTIWDGGNGAYVLDTPSARSLCLDIDGNMYLCGTNGFYGSLDMDGQYRWSGLKMEDFGPILDCLIAVETEIPALKIPVDFGIPTLIGDLYTAVPALGIGIAPAIPRDLLEFIGVVPLAKVYRVYLTGGTGPIELPISYLTIRRDATTTAITITCPSITSTQVDAILDRTAGMIVVKAGVRFSDGVEQMAEWARAGYSSMRWDEGSRSSSVTLTGLSTDLIANPQTRAARGISYYNMTGGRRRVRCAIDPHLAPGDTLDLGGGETMTVGELTISISASSAVMEAAESA